MTAIKYQTADVDGFRSFIVKLEPLMHRSCCCSTAFRPLATCFAI